MSSPDRLLAGLVTILAFAMPASAESCRLADVSVGSHHFRVEVPHGRAEFERGLMFRQIIPAGTGMLFYFGIPQHLDFWMKDTPSPLDILFISPEMRVHRIARDTVPFSTDLIPSEGKVIAVLEIGAGDPAALDLERGDPVLWHCLN